ncbi:MAG: MlaD family protein [Planctomycetota bacterium]|nr:MlaD family protein [Planctomycetota bacterium]MDA1177642.1 MlaD family protein [Planctomycetota bacterium]
MQFKVGVLVFASALITAILAMLFFRDFDSLGRRTRTIIVKFPSAPGVTIDTPVQKSGILIGRVRDVQLSQDPDDAGVTITAWVDSKHIIRRNEICRITSKSFLGDAVLEFVEDKSNSNKTVITEDEVMFDGVVATDAIESLQKLATMVAGLENDVVQALNAVEKAGTAIQTAGLDVSQVASRMNGFLDENRDRLSSILERAEGGLARLDSTLGSATTLMNSMNDIVGDPELRKQLENALRQVPLVLGDARDLLAGLQRVANEAETNLDNLQGLTAPLGEKGPQIVAAIEGGVGRLDELVGELIAVAKSVRSGKGTVYQLLNNPDLYQKLTLAVDNINEVAGELRPVVKNARVFTDKIARDPGRLGVKGALDRRASGTKLSVPSELVR